MNKIILYNTKAIKNTVLRCDRLPYGVLSIASVLKDDVSIVDGNVEELNLDDVKDCLCVGISMIEGYQLKEALEISKFVRKVNKDIPIIWGGWFPSMLPEIVLKDSNIDIVVRGQGELTFLELVNNLKQNKPLDNIKGISFRKDNKIINNPERELKDINEFPSFPYELLKLEKYENIYLNSRAVSYVASRGCPYRCTFCNDRIIYKGKVFEYSVKRVIEDLRILIEKYKFNAILFDDETFFSNKKRILEICKAIKKNKKDIN